MSRNVISEVRKAAKTPSGGRCVAASLLAAVAATGSALAQTTTPEGRMVQAFRTYCIETRAEPKLVRAEFERTRGLMPKGVTTFWNGGRYGIAKFSLSLDPPLRLWIGFAAMHGQPKRCSVGAIWAETQDLVRAVAAIGIADGEPTVSFEKRSHSELRRWTIRVGNSEAVVELGGPVWAGRLGDTTLTLLVAH